MIGGLLSSLGRRGPIVLIASLCGGLLIPPLGIIGRDLLPLSAFLLTLGSLLAAAFAPPEFGTRPRLVAMTLAWIGLALPLMAAAVLRSVPLDPPLRAGVLLSLLAPPVGSAAAIATIIGLQPRLALLASLTLTLAAPLSMPALSLLLNLGIEFNVGVLAMRLFVIIGAAVVVALAVVRWKSGLRAVLPDQRAATGVAVVGLVIVGLATSTQIHAVWAERPTDFLRLLGMAITLNFGLCAATTLIFARLGPQLAGTIGLVSGNRNVTLAWAAASVGLPQLAERYVAVCVIPVLTLPLIVRAVIALGPLVGLLLQRRLATASQQAPTRPLAPTDGADREIE